MWDFSSVSPEFGDLKNHPLGTGSGATLQGNRSEGYEVYVTVPSSYRGLRGLTKLQARCAGENLMSRGNIPQNGNISWETHLGMMSTRSIHCFGCRRICIKVTTLVMKQQRSG